MLRSSRFQPTVIWITGISAAGKTTLGRALLAGLRARGVKHVELLDGEDIRARLDRKYGHTLEDRFLVLEQIIKMSLDAFSNGQIVIVSTISHKAKMRQMARQRIPVFLEVYLKCSAAACAKRDYKGHYEKARRGDYECFVGVTEPYEESQDPKLTIDTETTSVDMASEMLIKAVWEFLKERSLGVTPREQVL